MSDMYMFSSGLNISAVIITVILLVATLLGRNLTQRVFYWFFCLVLFNLLGLASEAAVGLFMGTAGQAVRIAVHIADFFSYAFGAVAMAVFAMYLYEYLKTKTHISKTPVYIACILSCVTILLGVVAQFNSQISWLDESNYYHQGEYLAITYLPGIATFIMYAVIILRHMKVLKPREWIVLLLYIITPIVCYVIEWLYDDMWLIHFGYAVTLLLIITTIQVDLMQKVREQRAELAENRVSIMLSQIQPHFLYNTLTAISDLCKDNPKAGHALQAFSKYLRGNLDSMSMKKLILFEKELEHVKQYLWLEQLRFEERLQVEYDIREKDFMLPSLTLQPIVENAVLHGATQIRSGGRVSICAEEIEGSYRITVADNGAGFDPEAPVDGTRSHTGIANVRARLNAMCSGTLVIESEPGKGTVATIEIPKNSAAN